jgi:hypothetical protein
MAMANAELLDVLPTPPLPPTKTNWEFCVLLDGDLTINDAKVDVRLPVLLAVVLIRKVVVRRTCSAPGVEVRPRTAKDGATARRTGPTRTATLVPCATHNIVCKRTPRRATMTMALSSFSISDLTDLCFWKKIGKKGHDGFVFPSTLLL